MHWDGLGQRFSGRFVDGMDERMVALVLAQGAHHQQHEEFGAEMLRMAATSRTGGIPRQPRATMVYPVQRFDGLKAAQARGDRLMARLTTPLLRPPSVSATIALTKSAESA